MKTTTKVKKTAGERAAERAAEKIEFRDSGIHGVGGFARKKIRKGTPLIEYVGEKITKAEAAVPGACAAMFLVMERCVARPASIVFRSRISP